MLPWYILSFLLFISSRIADTQSTIRAVKAMEEAEAFGFEVDVTETNPYRSDKPTKELYDTKQIIMDGSALVPSIIFPPMSIAMSIPFYLIALKNNKLAKSFENKVKIVKKINN